MKLKIYSKQEKEQEVYLKLEKHGGYVVLMTTNKNGERIIAGALLFINSDGTIQLAENVNPNLGFQLDKQGKIKQL